MFKINKNQTVKLGKGFIELKKYSRQIPNLFKIMLIVSVFLPVLKELKKNGSYTHKNQDHIPCSVSYKLVCVNYKFWKPAVLYRGENAARKFIKAILEEYDYCKKVIEKNILTKM